MSSSDSADLVEALGLRTALDADDRRLLAGRPQLGPGQETRIAALRYRGRPGRHATPAL
jgi:hypothetical protein